MDVLRSLLGVLAAFNRWWWRLARGRVVSAVGGTARTRVVVLFGAVLALSSAQISTIGAVAPQLESSLHLDNTKIGLLNSVTLLVGAVAVIPVGMIVDRVKRIPMLSISIVLWSLMTIAGALAPSYGTLLLTRVALGVVSATAGPAIASLTGDYFPSRERGHVYGYILTGEILGTAVGFVICGNAAAALGWRVSFWILALPGFLLARELWRTVPEPLRGGSSRLERGATDLGGQVHDPTEEQGPARRREQDIAYRMAEEQGYRPDPRLVLRRDPDRMSITDAVRYILRIPTNTLLIFSSALGYFFFAGLQTFAVVFVRAHFHTGQGEATLVLGALVIGAIVGTLLSGPICDLLTRHGRLAARVWVPAVCQIGAGLALIPGLLANSLPTAVLFCFIGTGLISAANPPLDAARLDIMPPGLWGRAESTRTFLRSIAQALAPLVFGGVADLIAGFTPHGAPVGTHTGEIAPGTGTGLQVSFLIMIVSLFAAGWFLLRARSTYPRDVATAAVGFVPGRGAPRGGGDGGPHGGGSGGGGSGGGDAETWRTSGDDAPTEVARSRSEDETRVARLGSEDETRVVGSDGSEDETRVDAPLPASDAGPPDGAASEDATEPLVRPRDDPPRRR